MIRATTDTNTGVENPVPSVPQTMRAVRLDAPTKGRDVRLSEGPVPRVKPGWVLIGVHAFGLNHSEQMLRQHDVTEPYIDRPIIPGIECVGEVVDPSDTSFAVGQKVMAFMGGMGREFDGSYAEYVLMPAHHVFSVGDRTGLSWDELAAAPETYFTAWGSLFECLHLTPRDRLFVRGGTCALGYAAIQLAKALGCEVVATTHRRPKLELLDAAGVDEALLDDGSLRGKIGGITKAIDLVGPKVTRDTLRCVEPGGIVCVTGNLGGIEKLDGFDPIKDIPNGVYLTGFFSNTPSQHSMDALCAFLGEQGLVPKIGRVYPFEDIAEACNAQDEGAVDGKIVVTVGP